MKYFNDKFFKFFETLAKNNNKEWFEKNRSIYEAEVKVPFKKLVEDVTAKLVKDIPEINPNAAKAIFRINRDIRFSKNKAPYKTNVAAAFSRTGTKDIEYPGFYMHFGLDDIMVGGGKYFCSKQELYKLRQEILYNNKDFVKLLNDKAFKTKFGTLQGDKNKVLDKEFKEFMSTQPLIANKQFWYYTKLNRKDITSNDLDKLVLAHFKAAYKMNDWLWQTVKV